MFWTFLGFFVILVYKETFDAEVTIRTMSFHGNEDLMYYECGWKVLEKTTLMQCTTRGIGP